MFEAEEEHCIHRRSDIQGADGLIHAKGYTDGDMDLAFLILKVGGPMLL